MVRKAKAKGGRPWLIPGLVVGVVAAIGVGYAVWDSQTADPVDGDAPLRPLSTSELLGYLQAANAGREAAEIFDGTITAVEHPVAVCRGLYGLTGDLAAGHALSV